MRTATGSLAKKVLCCYRLVSYRPLARIYTGSRASRAHVSSYCDDEALPPQAFFTRENARTSRALGCCARCSGPSARRKRASAKFSPRATSRAAVVTPEDKENAPAPFSAEVAAAPFSAELTAGAFDDYGDCKQS